MRRPANKCPYGCEAFCDADSKCFDCATNPEFERCACGQSVQVLSSGKLAEHGCPLPFLPGAK